MRRANAGAGTCLLLAGRRELIELTAKYLVDRIGEKIRDVLRVLQTIVGSVGRQYGSDSAATDPPSSPGTVTVSSLLGIVKHT